MDEDLDTFTTSDGMQHIMGWAICECHVWLVSWRNREHAGVCGRCNKKARYTTLGSSKEKAYEIFRNVHKKEPEEF